jgi:hypothetical protein
MNSNRITFMTKTKIITTLAIAVAALAARAQYLEVNISSDFNQNIQQFTGGSNYPLGGTGLTIAGVPFMLGETNDAAGTTGAVQTPSGNTSYTFTIPDGTYATSIYTLMNTSWGEYGENEGSIIVTGSHGETATLNLTDGVNIRDHYDGFFENTLTDPTVVETDFLNGQVNASGPDRLDRQELALPASFNGDTLTSITFSGVDNGEPGGDPFLAALTVQEVPEPGPLAVFALGAFILGIRNRRK